MPNNSQHVALHTWLLLVSVMLIVMGVINGLAAWQLPAVWRPSPASLPLMLLAGVGLLTVLFNHPVSARLCGGLLLLFGLHAPLRALSAGTPLSPLLQAWPFSISEITSAVVLALSACLLAGVTSRRARLGWLLAGAGIAFVGALGVVRDCIPDAALPQALHIGFSSSFTALPTLLCGTGVLALGRYAHAERIAVPRVVVLALVGSLTASGLTWYVLTWQQYEAKHQHAAELLASFKASAEREVDGHQRLLQRMAERWAQLGDLPEPAFREVEFESYFRDIPSLVALHWQDVDEGFPWGKTRDASLDLPSWMASHQSGWLLDWLAVGGSYPRWVLPDPERPHLALVAVPLPGPSSRQLVAALDLERLFRDEVRSIITPLMLTMHRQGHQLPISPGLHGEPGKRLSTTQVVLPGGTTLESRGHAPRSAGPTLAGLMPLGVGVGGMILSYLMAFSLGLAGLSSRRAVALVATQRYLRAQQRVQAMIARDKPLSLTLRAICRLVETQSPGAMASIMLASRDQHSLEQAYSVSLPQEYLAAVSGVRVDERAGACGRAAYLRGFVVCADIANDPLWQGFHELTDKHGLRACWSYPVIASDGRVLGTFATYHREPCAPDAVERRRIVETAELVALAVERQQNRESLVILHRSVEASINGVVIADARASDMPMIYVNEAFERITGYRRDEVLGKNCRLLQGSETDSDVTAELRQALATCRDINVTLCNYRKDGTPFWNNLFVGPVRDAGGTVTHFVGILNDISQYKANEAKLAFHVSHDALTGLANRTLFEDHLIHDVQLARRHKSRLAVLFIDLDDFKPINDSLGHEVGDQVLVQVARRLGDELDLGDTLARFGSDEFVVLLPKLRHEEAALRLAERLLECIARPYRVGEHELYLSASVGVAFLSEDLASPVELIQQADMAMYRAKQNGRNAWQCFTGEINDEVSSRMALRNDLQEAIDAGNFELHYQPLLYAEDGRVAGVEALVRWKHPTRGYLSPGLFIPLAEETGQIVPISEWVLRQACRDMCSLEGEGFGRYRVSVNLSPLQFHRPNFLGNLQQALLETGLPAECLELELTEGILMDDTVGTIESLRLLRDMGVEVSIDDFGTGFSSLSYLKLLPIGKIKIDRSFVRDVTRNSHDSAIVQGIISMAHHLGLKVVAEGIEEAAQGEYLAAHGCDVFQGFYFARPMPLARLREYLVEHGDAACDAKALPAPVDR